MRLTGRLVEAAASKQDEWFDGYAVESRYLEVSGRTESPSYREAVARALCQGADPSFAFDLPEPRDLALETDLRITVRDPHDRVVGTAVYPLLNAVRENEPLMVRVARVDDAWSIGEPVLVRGRLQWRMMPAKTDGFIGFRVLANFEARDSDAVDFVPKLESTTITTGNTFTLSLPTAARLKNTEIQVSVTYPDGGVAATQSYALSALK